MPNTPQLPVELRNDLRKVKSTRRRAEQAMGEASRQTAEILRRMLELQPQPSHPQIADALGVSRQRVSQLVRKVKADQRVQSGYIPKPVGTYPVIPDVVPPAQPAPAAEPPAAATDLDVATSA